jgi:hypothetical protein
LKIPPETPISCYALLVVANKSIRVPNVLHRHRGVWLLPRPIVSSVPQRF